MSVVHDLRQSIRSLAKSPGFTAVAVATLGIGIGGSTAVFTVVDSVLLRPLNFAEPERLTQIVVRPCSSQARTCLAEEAVLFARASWSVESGRSTGSFANFYERPVGDENRFLV